MSLDDAWLDAANPRDLDALAHALLDGRVGAQLSRGSIQLAGFGEGAARFLDGLRGTPPHVVAWMLQRLSGERTRTDDRYASVASLVWSGASEGQQAIRDTKVVLDELFHRAERHVLIATFVVHDGKSVFERLAARLRERPEIEIEIELYVNLFPKDGRDEADAVANFRATFARDNWPSDVPSPTIYYDPETRRRSGKQASLHAKCVVVDRRWAFVTSANFTEAAQERNIEAGVLLDHPRLAETLAGQFEALKKSGRLKRMGAG